MLDHDKDTDHVRAWLQVALRSAAQRGLNATDLANHCGVTPQAVNGWRKTGRIRKSHLVKAAAFLGSEPTFGAAPLLARSTPFAPDWPFERVSPTMWLGLPIAARVQIEAYALFTISECAHSSAPTAQSTGATTRQRRHL